jgi:hypothetical protein
MNSKLLYNILTVVGLLACIGFWYLVIFTESFNTGDVSSDIYGILGSFIGSHGFTIFIFKLSKNAV